MPNDTQRERPLLMSAEMVRVILDGRKRQSRRVILPQPRCRIIEGRAGLTIGMDPALDGGAWYDADGITPGRLLTCPYGGIDGRLWVREAFTTWGAGDSHLAYRATDDPPHPDAWDGRWRPSIHMPRWASRLTLRITDVRVERVRQISEEDAQSEGVALGPFASYRAAFADLWDRLNAARGYGWDADPWCWCLTFVVVPNDA